MWKWLGIVLGALRSAFRTQQELALENLVLRQQIAVFKHHCQRPQLTAADRWFWVVLSRTTAMWRPMLHIAQPATVIRWHRQGFRSYWRWKSHRRGRPKIDRELRELIQEMSRANPLWGAPRIHGELLKLGFEVCQATVSRYMPKHRHTRPPSQTWRVFLRNHAKEMIAVDFLTVLTATFRVLFVLVVLSHDRRRILHTNVSAHPTAAWTARQLLEACGPDECPQYLVRDRDGIYGSEFRRMVAALGMTDCPVAPHSPWQNAYAERVIGTLRRDCLDHIVVLSERQLRAIVREYVSYYNGNRTHLALVKERWPRFPRQFSRCG